MSSGSPNDLETARQVSTNNDPIRVLELRSVFGTGGGPEKTILLGTARTDPASIQITVCYLRADDDDVFNLDAWARQLGVDYVEVVERRSFDPAIWKQLLRLTRECGAQIVHAHDYKTDLLAWLMSCRLGIIPLATAHGWTGHSHRERLVYYPLDKRLLARFPRVIAVSGEIKAELVRHGANGPRVLVVPNGIDHKAFKRDANKAAAARELHGVPPGRFAIGSVGRLEPQKRFDLLLASFARVLVAFPHTLLLIAGDGSQRAELESLRDRLKLGQSCRLLGHVDDIESFHHAIDLFVQSSDYEGTPNSVLEAMAFETPVVATTAGGTPELVRDRVDGLLVPCDDVLRLTAAMLEVLQNFQAARNRTHRARVRVETDLSFDTRMRKIDGLYRDLVPGSR